MNQNSVIFGALFIGFLVYITTRGRLPLYVGALWKRGTGSASNTPQTVQQATSGDFPIRAGVPLVHDPNAGPGLNYQPIPGL